MTPHPLSHLSSGRRVVVTGQQAGLFGGPLYTLYKLLGAVALARSSDATAVFWIECDDADIREVDHAAIVDRDGQVVDVATNEPDDGRSVADHRLNPDVTAAIDRLESTLAETDQRPSAIASLRAAYRPGVRWPDAFAAYLQDLIGDLAVVFVDPSAMAVKQAAAPFFKRVIEMAAQVETAIATGTQSVADPQVPFRAGELPVFLLDTDGRRRKLERRDDGVALKGTDTVLSWHDLATLVDREPARFSAAVLLRPVLQDWLLPTTAYVAGPSESQYHAQLGPLYELLQVARPQIVARPRFTLIEPRVRRALGKLDATPTLALDGRDELVAHAIRSRVNVDPQVETAHAIKVVGAELDALRDKLAAIEPGQLDQAFDEARRKLTYQLEKLGTRAATALERQHLDVGEQAQRVAAAVVPAGKPQERVLSPVQFTARMPPTALVERLLNAIDGGDLGRHQFVETD